MTIKALLGRLIRPPVYEKDLSPQNEYCSRCGARLDHVDQWHGVRYDSFTGKVYFMQQHRRCPRLRHWLWYILFDRTRHDDIIVERRVSVCKDCEGDGWTLADDSQWPDRVIWVRCGNCNKSGDIKMPSIDYGGHAKRKKERLLWQA